MRISNSDRYEKLIQSMNVPESRKKATSENARWFLRHGGICNLQHKHFHDVLYIAQRLS